MFSYYPLVSLTFRCLIEPSVYFLNDGILINKSPAAVLNAISFFLQSYSWFEGQLRETHKNQNEFGRH